MKSKRVAAGAENLKREVAQSEETRPQPLNGPSVEEIQRQAYEIHIDRAGQLTSHHPIECFSGTGSGTEIFTKN